MVVFSFQIINFNRSFFCQSTLTNVQSFYNWKIRGKQSSLMNMFRRRRIQVLNGRSRVDLLSLDDEKLSKDLEICIWPANDVVGAVVLESLRRRGVVMARWHITWKVHSFFSLYALWQLRRSKQTNSQRTQQLQNTPKSSRSWNSVWRNEAPLQKPLA